jgi:hypothetical protein
MKTITKISGLALLLILVFSSCRKALNFGHKKEKVEILDVDFTVKAGETITYQVPAGKDDDDVDMILTNSTLAITSALENSIYTYTAPTSNPSDFTDLVVIASVEDHGGGKGHHGNNGSGQCGNQNNNGPKSNLEVERLINLHITVKAGTSGK